MRLARDETGPLNGSRSWLVIRGDRLTIAGAVLGVVLAAMVALAERSAVLPV